MYAETPSPIKGNPALGRTNYLDEALGFYERGWTVIPMRRGERRPAVRWKAYQTRRPERDLLPKWFGGWKLCGGIAVILGRASGGLACRDFDDLPSYERWAEAHPDLAAALPTAKTRRGRHVYFRAKSDQFTNCGEGEYRGDQRHYTVLPPSIHHSGTVAYEWLIPPPPGKLPLISDPVAAGLMPPPVPTRTKADRHLGSEKGKDSERMGHSRLCEQRGSRGSGRFPDLTGLDPEGSEIDRAIVDTLPTGPGQRHHAVFDLVQRLKTLPEYKDKSAQDLDNVLRRWHAAARPVICTKDYWEISQDFENGWECYDPNRAEAVFEMVWDAAGGLLLPGSEAFGSDLGRVVRLCFLLQQRAGNEPFPLDCRALAERMGKENDGLAGTPPTGRGRHPRPAQSR